MNKSTLCRELAKLLAPNDPYEQQRLWRYHSNRPIADIRESYARQQAIAATTDAECRRHCQLTGLPRL